MNISCSETCETAKEKYPVETHCVRRNVSLILCILAYSDIWERSPYTETVYNGFGRFFNPGFSKDD
jgi:hypothetical protein